MIDSNFYVLEVRDGVILYLNERTQVRDGWYWGPDDKFVDGPFANQDLAIADARQHSDKPLNLIVWNADNFDDADEPSASGNLIVVDTRSRIWVRTGESIGGRGLKEKKDVKRVFAELERVGLIMRTGEFRRGQPVFVAAVVTEEKTKRRLAMLDDDKTRLIAWQCLQAIRQLCGED
jgi:hypothetical protein